MMQVETSAKMYGGFFFWESSVGKEDGMDDGRREGQLFSETGVTFDGAILGRWCDQGLGPCLVYDRFFLMIVQGSEIQSKAVFYFAPRKRPYC
jgi:hypothetical protein